MKITFDQKAIPQTEQQLLQIRKELTNLLKQRDKIQSEIINQRIWKTEVTSKLSDVTYLYWFIKKQLESITLQLKDNKVNFYNLENKQKQILKNINKELQSKLEELNKINNNIEIQKRLLKREEELKDKIKEWLIKLTEQKNKFNKLNTEMKENTIKLNNREEKINKKEVELALKEKSLEESRVKLEKRHNRLIKLSYNLKNG